MSNGPPQQPLTLSPACGLGVSWGSAPIGQQHTSVVVDEYKKNVSRYYVAMACLSSH